MAGLALEAKAPGGAIAEWLGRPASTTRAKPQAVAARRADPAGIRSASGQPRRPPRRLRAGGCRASKNNTGPPRWATIKHRCGNRLWPASKGVASWSAACGKKIFVKSGDLPRRPPAQLRRATGVVIFAHGSGSSRRSPRNRFVAAALNQAGLGTLQAEVAADLLKHQPQPLAVRDVGVLQPHLSGLHGYDAKCIERPGVRRYRREVQQAQIVAELLVAADAFVVVDAVAAAVQDEPAR